MLIPSLAASAETTGYQVQVGAFHQGTPSETMRFLPARLRVHRGDTITFSSESFHTATFLPEEAEAEEWIEDNVSRVDAPYSVFVSDPDEGERGLKFNNRVAFPTDPTCGSADQPCLYDGTQELNSGVFVFRPGSFTATVDVAPGESFWVICLVHQAMRMRITVVDDTAAASTQAEIDQAKEQQVASDADEAAAMHSRLSTRRSKHTTASGKRVWDAWAGFDMPGVSLLAMYPRKLSIRKGDSVRWHFGSLEYEVHTVTFPRSKGLDIANNSFVPGCDPDGDSGTEPDSPPQMEGPPFCEDPRQLELDLDPRFTDQGDGIVRSARDFENSGVRGDFLSRAPFDLRFPAGSPDAGFKYVCMIHPFMQGNIVVK
jgi:plastocyanin